MKQKVLIYLFLFSWFFVSCEQPVSNDNPKKPNIVIIYADDLGYGDLSCYGNDAYQTPNLDRLAQDGVRFTNFYTAPVCTPARASLLTGCYADRVGLPRVIAPKGPAWTEDRYHLGLNPEEETIAELLKQKNYATACIGKWHLGDNPEHLPTNQGFDEYFGIPYSNDMWPINKPEWPPLPLMEGTEVVDIIENDQSHLTTLYTQRALDFIERNQENSFFLYLAHSMPHVPLFVSDRGSGRSGAGLYGDVIAEIDWSVGQIVAHLEKLGLAENTLVMFTSDNGPWLIFGSHAGSAGPLREGKHTIFEGGVRVPFIAKWPGKIPAGRVEEKLAGVIDILPTLISITGAANPKKTIDGKNIESLFKAEENTSATGREVQFFWHDAQLKAVRKGKWKLVFPHEYPDIEVPGGNGKRGSGMMTNQPLALYDLEVDNGENQNLADRHPEIVKELTQLAELHTSDIDENRRPPGMVKR